MPCGDIFPVNLIFTLLSLTHEKLKQAFENDDGEKQIKNQQVKYKIGLLPAASKNNIQHTIQHFW